MIWMNCLKIKETCGACSKGTYTHVEFKRDVLAHLQKKFDSSVKPGNKAVEVEASGSGVARIGEPRLMKVAGKP
jgi:hypothetical protein